ARLRRAASTRLGAPVAELQVRDGTIARTGSDARTTHWEVAGDSLQREATAQVAPKPANAHRFIGQSVPRRDIPGKVTGQPAYVQDVRLPGMVHARVVRPAIPRAKLVDV